MGTGTDLNDAEDGEGEEAEADDEELDDCKYSVSLWIQYLGCDTKSFFRKLMSYNPISHFPTTTRLPKIFRKYTAGHGTCC